MEISKKREEWCRIKVIFIQSYDGNLLPGGKLEANWLLFLQLEPMWSNEAETLNQVKLLPSKQQLEVVFANIIHCLNTWEHTSANQGQGTVFLYPEFIITAVDISL